VQVGSHRSRLQGSDGGPPDASVLPHPGPVDQLGHSRLLSEEVAIEAHLRLLKKRLRIPLLRIYVFAGLRSLSGFSRYQTPKAACTQPPTHWASRKVYWRNLTNLLDLWSQANSSTAFGMLDLATINGLGCERTSIVDAPYQYASRAAPSEIK
jgi:hypothetical protein